MNPIRTAALELHELASRCGVDVPFLHQLLELGIIETHPDDASRFSLEVSLRVHRCVRLQRDLGVNLEGVAVIIELLDRIEALEHQLHGLRYPLKARRSG
jgi:chaperone modulatory protein CbpM